MSENTESQIKSPLEKKQKTEEQSVENGVEKAIKKTLPKIVKNISNTIETPIKNTTTFIGENIKAGLNSSADTISKGFGKLKDFGSDLLTDVTELTSDIISPGGLTTMLTGSPLLGAMVGNKLEDMWGATKELITNVEDNFASVKDSAESNNDDSIVSDELTDGIDVTNSLLSNMLNTNKEFNDMYKDNQEQIIKDKRAEILRNEEIERERLDALKKNDNDEQPIININNEEKKEGWFSKLFTKIKGTGAGILSSIGMLGALLAKAAVTITAILAVFNGIYTFFNKLSDGASIKEALIAGLTDFIHVLTLGLIDKDLINNIVTFFVSPIYDFITNLGKSLFGVVEGLWDTIAGLFTADWERVKEGLFHFGDSVEGIFDSIINYFVDIVKGIFDIGKKIGGWFSKWFSDDDIEEQEKQQKEREKQLENIKFKKSSSNVQPILEDSKKITEYQTPIHTTVINNNTNNMTQMSNNNAIGKTNMIVGSSLRNNDPTFNQCLINSMIPNM